MIKKILFALIFIIVVPELALACSFEHNTCDYETHDWKNQEDFSHVVMSWIPEHGWDVINQSKITGYKVGEIPVNFFNSSQILDEELIHVSKYQIISHIEDFKNLKLLDQNILKEVFLEFYNIDIDLSNLQNVSFFQERFIGEFPEYNSSFFSKENFKQVLNKNKIKILNKERNDLFLEIKGAKNFSLKEDELEIYTKINNQTIIKGHVFGTIKTNQGHEIFFQTNQSINFTNTSNFNCMNCELYITQYNISKQALAGNINRTKNVINIMKNEGSIFFYDLQKETLAESNNSISIIFNPNYLNQKENYVLLINDTFKISGELLFINEDYYIKTKSNSFVSKKENEMILEGGLIFEDGNIVYESSEKSKLVKNITQFNDPKYHLIKFQETNNITIKTNYLDYTDEEILREGPNIKFLFEKENNFKISNPIKEIHEIQKDENKHFTLNNFFIISFEDSKIIMRPDLSFIYLNGGKEIFYDNTYTPSVKEIEDALKELIVTNEISLLEQLDELQELFFLKLDEGTQEDEAFKHIISLINEVYEERDTKLAIRNAFMLYNAEILFEQQHVELVEEIEAKTRATIFLGVSTRYFFHEDASKIKFGDLFPHEQYYEDATFHVDNPSNFMTETQEAKYFFNKIIFQNDVEKTMRYRDLVEIELKNVILFYKVFNMNRYDYYVDEAQDFFSEDFDADAFLREQLNKQSVQEPDKTYVPSFEPGITYREYFFKRVRTNIDKATRILIFLEDSEILSENNLIILKHNSLKFSTRKLELATMLISFYIEKGESGKAITVADTLIYLLDVSIQEMDIDLEDKKNIEAIRQLRKQLNELRLSASSAAIELMQINIFQAEAQVEALMNQRSSYIQRVQNRDAFGSLGASLVLSGGLFKIFIPFREANKIASSLSEEYQVYSQGLNTLNLLMHKNIPPREIETYSSGRAGVMGKNIIVEKLIQNGFTTSDEHFSFLTISASSSNDKNKVFNLLEQEKQEVITVFTNSPFKVDLPRVIGVEIKTDLEFNKGRFDFEEQGIKYFLNDLEQLELGNVARVLNYIDDAFTSPVSLALMIGTGGFGLTVTGARGVAGVGVSALEALVIDTATGIFVVSAGFEDSMLAPMITGVVGGIGLGGAYRGFRSAATNMPRTVTDATKRVSSRQIITGYGQGYPASPSNVMGGGVIITPVNSARKASGITTQVRQTQPTPRVTNSDGLTVSSTGANDLAWQINPKKLMRVSQGEITTTDRVRYMDPITKKYRYSLVLEVKGDTVMLQASDYSFVRYSKSEIIAMQPNFHDLKSLYLPEELYKYASLRGWDDDANLLRQYISGAKKGTDIVPLLRHTDSFYTEASRIITGRAGFRASAAPLKNTDLDKANAKINFKGRELNERKLNVLNKITNQHSDKGSFFSKLKNKFSSTTTRGLTGSSNIVEETSEQIIMTSRFKNQDMTTIYRKVTEDMGLLPPRETIYLDELIFHDGTRLKFVGTDLHFKTYDSNLLSLISRVEDQLGGADFFNTLRTTTNPQQKKVLLNRIVNTAKKEHRYNILSSHYKKPEYSKMLERLKAEYPELDDRLFNLHNGGAVCGDMSELYQLILAKNNIPSRKLVLGNPGDRFSHAVLKVDDSIIDFNYHIGVRNADDYIRNFYSNAGTDLDVTRWEIQSSI